MERQAVQIAEYLAGLTTEMIRMARDAELDTLAYLLSVAHLEALASAGVTGCGRIRRQVANPG